jgi:hypothetical protein
VPGPGPRGTGSAPGWMSSGLRSVSSIVARARTSAAASTNAAVLSHAATGAGRVGRVGRGMPRLGLGVRHRERRGNRDGRSPPE